MLLLQQASRSISLLYHNTDSMHIIVLAFGLAAIPILSKKIKVAQIEEVQKSCFRFSVNFRKVFFFIFHDTRESFLI